MGGVGGVYLIHCWSSVTVSPGVTMSWLRVFARFAGRRSCIMSTSPSDSKPPLSDDSLSYSGAAGAGGRIVIAIGSGQGSARPSKVVE